MHDFILIRELQAKDKIQCDELVKNYLMECSREAFMTVLFQEITLQLIVLVCALCFIFFGMPPLVCLCAVPVVLLLMFLSVYTAYFNKAVDLCNTPPQMCWVAELHYKGLDAPKGITEVYSNSSKQNLDLIEANRCRKMIIGTAAVKLHESIDNSAWLYRVAFSSSEYFKSTGEPLLARVLQFCVKQRYYYLETVARECDDEYKDLLVRSGFNMRQIYNKKVIGNSLKIMKAQMRVDVTKWSSSGNA